MSGRARKLRLSISFARSFATLLSRTDASESLLRSSFSVKCSHDSFVCGRRVTSNHKHSPVEFIFYRNFVSKSIKSVTITVSRPQKEPIRMICSLPYKRSFIGLCNYTPQSGPKLFYSTIPIYLKTTSPKGEEIWIVQSDEEFSGQFAFYGPIKTNGTLDPIYRIDNDLAIVSFKKTSGWACICSADSRLIVIALSGKDLLTLNPVFEEPHWFKDVARASDEPVSVFWGCYGGNYNYAQNSVDAQFWNQDESLFGISLNSSGAVASGYEELGFVWHFDGPKHYPKTFLVPITQLSKRKVDFGGMPWLPLQMNATNTIPTKNAIDYCYTSGHVLYKLEFETTSTKAVLKVNMRHRLTLMLNNILVGGNIVYSLAACRPGAKNGPDFTYGGWHTYVLPESALQVGSNTLVFVIESFGLNRQPFVLNDVRNPRGLLEARVSGSTHHRWSIAGVDVRKLDNPFMHSGFPDETLLNTNTVPNSSLGFIAEPSWYHGEFGYSQVEGTISPLCLNMQGTATAYVFLNNLLIARYYGNGDGPQHDFLVPSGCVVNGRNEIKMLAYGRVETDTLAPTLGPWIIEQTSGNIEKDGTPFILLQTDIKL